MVGKLIVIEGADASGKQTQSDLLIERLAAEGFEAEKISFPRYETFFGGLVKKYLSGEFGEMDSVPAELASLLYALDRYNAVAELNERLEAGKIVIADRFSASNIAHQAAKLPEKERSSFVDWLRGVESRLPKSKVTIYLDVPVPISQELMQKQARVKDLHEQNVDYLEAVRSVYLKLAETKGWKKIDCVKKGNLLSIAEIQELVWKAVKPHL